MQGLTFGSCFWLHLPYLRFVFLNCIDTNKCWTRWLPLIFGSAKCTLESDRTLIHDQVLDLFDEALEPPICVDFTGGSDQHTTHEAGEFPLLSPEEIRSIRHLTSYPTADEVIDHFNAHVRGPLRDSLVQSIGKEEYLFIQTLFGCHPSTAHGWLTGGTWM